MDIKKFSTKSITNTLIVFFGVVILVIVILLGYQTLFPSADNVYTGLGLSYPTPENLNQDMLPDYRINTSVASYPVLEILNQSEVNSIFGDSSGTYPGYKLTFTMFSGTGEPKPGVMGIVPLNKFDYANLNVLNYSPSESSPAYRLLTYGLSRASGTQGSDRVLINNSIVKYREAINLASKTYAIEGNTLYSIDPRLRTTSNYDPNVTRNTSFPGRKTVGWSLSISIDPNAEYREAANNSLALSVLSYSLASATNLHYDTEGQQIRAAYDKYRALIPTQAGTNGLTIQSVDSIPFGQAASIGFGIDFTKFPEIDSQGAYIRSIMLNVQDTNICKVSFSNRDDEGTATIGCTWGGRTTNRGAASIDANSPGAISTNQPGNRTITLKAYSNLSDTAPLRIITKQIAITNNWSDQTIGSGLNNFGITITTPATVSTSQAAVPIKIHTGNLNPSASQNDVAALAWYICVGRAENHPTDSRNCEQRGRDASLTANTAASHDYTYAWNVTGSQAGSYRYFMVKTWSPDEWQKPQSEQQPNSQVFSGNILISATSQDDENNGGGDGGPTDQPSPDANIPSWLANIGFSKSGITSVNQLIGRIGGFTLMTLGAIAIIAIIMAGLKYITSGGDEKKAETGKKALLFAIFGIIIASLSVMLIQVTIKEIQHISGVFPSPSSTDIKIPTSRTGPTAEIINIIGQDGLAWNLIRLAAYWAQAVAVFYVIYASYLYMMSFGDESKAEAGKKTLIWALIGLAVVLSANIILRVLTGIVV
jgi:hypothetical protein